MKIQTALEKYSEWMMRERLSLLTQESYMGWVERYFEWSKYHRAETPEITISNFLSTYQKHSEATVKQALNALVGKSGFFPAMGKTLEKLPPWVNPTRPANIPTWVTQTETEAIMLQLIEPWAMMAAIMFGSGLRIGECANLRWRDIDFERLTITIHRGKGKKDRITVLSRRLVEPLQSRMARCQALWEEDRLKNRNGIAMPEGMELKFKNMGKDWPFFWVFPSRSESKDPQSGIIRRHHLHKKAFGSALRVAVRRARINKRVTAHTFRHGFATAYLLAGGNLRELQRLLGHTHLETTEIYLHCLPNETDRIGSPWDVSTTPPPISNIITPRFKTA